MATTAIVRTWSDIDGWGVLDSAETPGGCWAHYSRLAMGGYRTLRIGEQVELEWEAVGDQDGYRFRALRAWPAGAVPVVHPVDQGPSGAYISTLTITYDSPDEPEGPP